MLPPAPWAQTNTARSSPDVADSYTARRLVAADGDLPGRSLIPAPVQTAATVPSRRETDVRASASRLASATRVSTSRSFVRVMPTYSSRRASSISSGFGAIVGRRREQLRVLDADDVDARELQPLRRMQREQIHAHAFRLVAVPLREHGTLEKEPQLGLERPIGKIGDQSSQSQHRRRIAFVGALVGPNLHHQLHAAEPLDHFVDRGERRIVVALALVRLETGAVATEREDARDAAEQRRLVAERLFVAQRERDAEVVEQIDERRLARARTLHPVERDDDLAPAPPCRRARDATGPSERRTAARDRRACGSSETDRAPAAACRTCRDRTARRARRAIRLRMRKSKS